MHDFIPLMFSLLNNLRLFHWNTDSYAQHIASDSCITVMQELFDKFMEVFLGKYGKTEVANIQTSLVIETLNKEQLEEVIREVISFLNTIDISADTDLQNVRDDMLTELHKTLYLFSLT